MSSDIRSVWTCGVVERCNGCPDRSGFVAGGWTVIRVCARGLPTRGARRARLGCGITAKSVQILPGERRAARLCFRIRCGTRSEKEETSRGERNEVASLGRRAAQAAETLRWLSRRETPAGYGLSIGCRFAPSTLPFPSFSSWITTASYNGHASFTERNKREWLRMNELIIRNILRRQRLLEQKGEFEK